MFVFNCWGWSGGAIVLGKLPVPGLPTICITVVQGPPALAVGAGGGCLDIFTLIYPFSPPSPSLWGTARYRLKYCLKGPLNPKQPTNFNCYHWQQKQTDNNFLLLYYQSPHFASDGGQMPAQNFKKRTELMLFTSNCGLAFIYLFYRSVDALNGKSNSLSGSWGGRRWGKGISEVGEGLSKFFMVTY